MGRRRPNSVPSARNSTLRGGFLLGTKGVGPGEGTASGFAADAVQVVVQVM